MKKFWIVLSGINGGTSKRFEKYADAEDEAKRRAAIDRENEYIVLEAITVTKKPIPNIEMIRLTLTGE